MAGLQIGDFYLPYGLSGSPDKTKVDVVRMGDGATAARLTLQPGWRWSECIKPVAGDRSCQVLHVGFLQSGRMHVTHVKTAGHGRRAGQGICDWNWATTPGSLVMSRSSPTSFQNVKAAEQYARG